MQAAYAQVVHLSQAGPALFGTSPPLIPPVLLLAARPYLGLRLLLSPSSSLSVFSKDSQETV